MKLRQAYKFELNETGSQAHAFRKVAGSCRFIFNWGLGLRIETYYISNQSINYYDLADELVDYKLELAWLAETPSQTLQQSLKDLDKAYGNFFAGRADFPKFKKKGINDSFRYPQGCKLNEAAKQIFLPKIGWVKYRRSQFIEGDIKNVTVSRRGNKWYISVQTEREVPDPIHPSKSMAGFDMGIAIFAAGSDGTMLAPLNAHKTARPKLAKLQRKMAKQVKFSSNWNKTKEKLTRLHIKISDRRKDFLHKGSSAICKKHAVVVLEDLRVKNMSASAKGSVEEPGKNVAAKSGLNRAILDQGWGEFRRQVEYKQSKLGGRMILVDPKNTSRECKCGHVSKDNRKTQSVFKCVKCGYEANADFNASCRVEAAGHAVLACGEEYSRSSEKQEPEVVKGLLVSIT